ncbi:Fic family protein [Candidatus Dojkabacteria bacterium]|uniref:Fic family protein n=1 Tax=Candidatus Dojkabacteria bacterium TaxID=2099670 RepID=A0A955L773_9BACT|nr:Fic family protein [Candidatus Dojkabacteria bacterium]
MNINYQITNTTLNEMSRFFDLHGRIYAVLDWISNEMSEEVIKANRELSAYAAVSNDKTKLKELASLTKPNLTDILSFLPGRTKDGVKRYTDVLNEFDTYIDSPSDFTLKTIKDIHLQTTGNEKFELRTSKRILPIEVWENGIHDVLEFPVQTKPEDIEKKLQDFLKWFKQNYNIVNPIVLAAIAHFKIAEIHPFNDGNGRLARILGRGILYINEIDTSRILPIDNFYLKNQQFYYTLLDTSIKDKDLTHWIEFMTKGLLEAAIQTCQFILEVSGGSIDLINTSIIELTGIEQKIVKIIRENEYLNGSDIARELGKTRQYVNIIMKDLIEKGIVTKTGANTSVRYSLAKL